MTDDVVVTRNEDERRFEARIGGVLAGFAEYRLTEEQIFFTHTEVDPEFEGRGVGGALARHALDEVAAEGTRFADVVGTRLGMCGMEYFAHPWEFGPRKTKELMLTGDSISADEAYGLGMVSKIFPADQLADDTLDFARRIAEVPTMAALMIKESVNQTVDNMGFHNSLNACFTLHELNHAHWAWVREDGYPIAGEEQGVPNWKTAPPIVGAQVDKVRAEG